MPLNIVSTKVSDIRVPTSDSLLGSDPFHKKPNYSCVYTTIELSNGVLGNSVCFTSGAGNDWIAYGVKDILKLIKNYNFNEFIANPGKLYKMINDHHQLRWLADGVNRMALGCVMNSMWDCWAKIEKKPLWKLLVDLDPQTIIDSIDWRYLKDAILPEEAKDLLNENLVNHNNIENSLSELGPKAYSTAGWLGLTDEQIKDTINEMKEEGFDCFKMKVGQDINHDLERLAFIRDQIGYDAKLMLDCNQVWGVDEAIEYMNKLAIFKPTWIEEPTARDDVQGHLKIAKAIEPLGIKVATGEQVPSPVIFKQMLQSGAIGFCQIDASRLGGVNDVIAVILLAKKYNVPVCPHGGGIGLCNMIVHYSLWDQIKVSSNSDNQLVEYLNFLQDDVFTTPVSVKDGRYVTPKVYGWGLEMKKEFFESHIYPTGSIWKDRVESGSITFTA
ncbi:MAG: mandelate racemase/muconate lactonizing enzyme domain-containing protein [Dehalococcoidia bacterium]|nr:mandelate racemase/muconate lactonizing enzyme domain-containing protein [Dehalococcoidia bacterium]|tara:strand:- start:5466 stop:6794 length:1329 start_codon:yes stop_codon:yes gene_type:complete